MPPLNQRFKSSYDYRVAASGRFARGTVLGGDHVGILPHSTDFSLSLYRVMVLPSWDRDVSDGDTIKAVLAHSFSLETVRLLARS